MTALTPADIKSSLVAPLVLVSGPWKGTNYHGEQVSITGRRDEFPASGVTEYTGTTGLYSYAPHKANKTATNIRGRTLAVPTQVSLTITPGPGCFGRLVTVSWAWVPSSYGTVRSLNDMAAIPGYRTTSFGGHFQSSIVAAPIHDTVTFDDLLLQVFYSPTIHDHFQLVMHVAATDVGNTQVDSAPWFNILHTHSYQTWGGI